jgi:GxxExxY protein
MLARPSALAEIVIGSAIEVHRALGPGLFESAYESCLAVEFTTRGVRFSRQVPVPVNYKGRALHLGYRADFVVDDTILLELKTVERLIPLHKAQVITYLKLLGLRQGLIFNFNSERLVDGMRNILL